MSQRILHYSNDLVAPRSGVCPFALSSALLTLLCIALMAAAIFVVPGRVNPPSRTLFEVRVGTWLGFATVCSAVLGAIASVVGLVIGRAKRASGMFLFINALCLLISFVWLIL